MRKIFLIIFVFVTVSLSAKSALINFTWNTSGHYLGVKDNYLTSFGLNFVFLGNSEGGFYMQLNPHSGFSMNGPSSSGILRDNNASSLGLSTILGYGGSLDWGRTGLIIGGGIYLDLIYYLRLNIGQDTEKYLLGIDFDFDIASSVGLAMGTNFYIHPGPGNFVFNLGVMAAWHPYSWLTAKSNDGFRAGQFTVHVNFGIGWSRP